MCVFGCDFVCLVCVLCKCVLCCVILKVGRASHIHFCFPYFLSSPQIEKMVSELGIFGVFLAKGDQILTNEFAGHLLRTKQSFNDEGGVCAGYAGLDSPFLQ